MADKTKKGRQKKGESCHNAKLNEAKVIEIRRRYASGGIYQYNLAKEFSVPQSTISKVINRQSWNHVE